MLLFINSLLIFSGINACFAGIFYGSYGIRQIEQIYTLVSDLYQSWLFHWLGDFISQRYKKIIHIKYLILSQSFAGEKIMLISYICVFSR